MTISKTPPLALCLTLLLAACNTQNVRQAEHAPATSSPSASTALRSPLPAAEAPALEFDGPRVVFAPGSSELPRTAAPVLNEVAAKLKSDPLVNVVLVGHTEDVGSAEFSVAVATRCAQAVGQALVKRGVRPSQIRMQPRGHSKTAARQCSTAACKKQMRRVDIVMSEY
ncbi:MAG: OmpA family protein [Rhodocyclaceae bacterium]|nr:OmpA family protein [Rhodocyclaceae bacterium]